MTYKIYTTDGFIIKARPSKDADLSILVFTEELGLLNASAKSVRLERSKLRFSLQSMTFSSISFVKGREVWRVTSAKKHISLYDKRLSIEIRTMFARMLMFIERFCPREQQEVEIFALLKQISGFAFKELQAKIADHAEYIEAVELFFILKSLYILGYVKDDEITEYLNGDISITLIEKLSDEAESSKMRKIIERGINESHL